MIRAAFGRCVCGDFSGAHSSVDVIRHVGNMSQRPATVQASCPVVDRRRRSCYACTTKWGARRLGAGGGVVRLVGCHGRRRACDAVKSGLPPRRAEIVRCWCLLAIRSRPGRVADQGDDRFGFACSPAWPLPRSRRRASSATRASAARRAAASSRRRASSSSRVSSVLPAPES